MPPAQANVIRTECRPAPRLTAAFGEIVSTLDWRRPAWQALMTKLETAGKPVAELTLADIVAAIEQVRSQMGEVHR